VISVGYHAQADYRLLNFQQSGLDSCCDLVVNHQQTIHLTLPMPGKHNVCNAAMALACVHRLGGDWQIMLKAMQQFKGVGRRFSICGRYQFNASMVTLINDYGHHPTELSVTLDAAQRAYPSQRLVMAFEPHRFSRTQELLDEFVEVLLKVDCLLLLDTHTAGESVSMGVSSDQLHDLLKAKGMNHVYRVGQLDTLHAALVRYTKENDVVILQGAGGIGYLPQSWQPSYCSNK
jgi:UDP-N-acetylmuramate--alanine ligase